MMIARNGDSETRGVYVFNHALINLDNMKAMKVFQGIEFI